MIRLVPVEESAALRFPDQWPPPLFREEDAIPDERQFVIEEGGEAIGLIALGPPGARVEVGYSVMEAHRDRGVATAALAVLIELCDAPELYARVRLSSAASIRVLQKNGFARSAETSDFLIFTRRRG